MVSAETSKFGMSEHARDLARWDNEGGAVNHQLPVDIKPRESDVSPPATTDPAADTSKAARNVLEKRYPDHAVPQFKHE